MLGAGASSVFGEATPAGKLEGDVMGGILHSQADEVLGRMIERSMITYVTSLKIRRLVEPGGSHSWKCVGNGLPGQSNSATVGCKPHIT
eukprot:1152804-Pelagomonas_calceolata.AAC.4